ncbi:hypothetical protein P389DRAFT_10674 [Cystobasidium minutum MCA 4210]|uniref:uncharacterized protein n=1 Tax=Cystobasidium minutum MCA 4210 TaxID=1397322 RepID=UPI0034CF3BBE|eukprot:jgi/Rhomi1/10674/CE10673_191
MPIRTCSSAILPTMHHSIQHLEAGLGAGGARRRVAIAISSKQYKERQKRQQMKQGRCAANLCNDAFVKRITSASTLESASATPLSVASSATAAASSAVDFMNTKQERRAQMKAELDDEYAEAICILHDEQSSSVDVPDVVDMTDEQQPAVPSLMSLEEVAVMKPARAGVDSFVHLARPVNKVVVIDDADEEVKRVDNDGWEMLDDDATFSSGAPALTVTFAEVVAGGR